MVTLNNTKAASPLDVLMKAAMTGDQMAYRKFLSEASVILRRFLIKRMAADDVEDVLQEILTSVHKAKNTYDGKRPVLPWMYAIARFRLTDHLRKHYSTQKGKHVPIEDVEHFLEAPVTETHEFPEYISEAVSELPEKQQKIIYLMHVEGYTAKEVGRQLGMGESAVKVAAHRIYKKMRENLKRPA